jgi:hypothetical protein
MPSRTLIARNPRTGPAPVRDTGVRRRENTRPHVSSVSASTTAMNSAAGSFGGAPVGTLWVCCGAACSTMLSKARGFVPVRHDTASTSNSVPMPPRRWCRRQGPGGPQCWYCDVHLPISWPYHMPERASLQPSWLHVSNDPARPFILGECPPTSSSRSTCHR